ncbi:MAG: GntR family transcriptional regulator [Treponema sp.]|jgi:DNA-binding LacI/PurR family transcriptional regulator|nr:GntR family transcriptional regulator [Treponema sp.]
MNNEKIEAENGPLYQLIYNQLLKDIRSGKLAPGNKTPSEKELCDTYGVSRITSKKALEMLSEEGIIVRRPGLGSFVADNFGEEKEEESGQRSIGFLISDFNDTFGTRLIYSVEEACGNLGYHLILKRTKESQDEEKKALRSLIDEKVAGILMIPVHGEYYNGEILNQTLRKRPFVFVDRKMPGLPVPAVSTDTVTASVMAVKELLDLGHRNIAFFSRAILHTSTIEDRKYGFIKAFSDYGLPFTEDFFCPPLASSNDIGMVTRYLMEHPEITAAFTSEFEIALLVKLAVETMGRKIPSDFSIITFDSPEYVSDFTYIKQDEHTMGKKAVEMLHRIISGTDAASIEDVLLPAELVPGKSVQRVINN